MEKLMNAIDSRGWTLYRASVATGIPSQSIRNLVGVGSTRDTHPRQVSVDTAVRLLETFHELDLDDFVPGSKVSVRE
jgi:hypothetical protein